MLYINGQDIARFAVATIDGSEIRSLEVVSPARPEQFLALIDAHLKSVQRTSSDIERILVVTGPGSATALRASLSIVNTMVFALGIEVGAVEKEPMQEDQAFLRSILDGGVEVTYSKSFVAPVYAHEPRITKSNKDHLRRDLKG